MARTVVWLCACACALLVARAAPAPPERTHAKESKVQDKTIVVRRMPNAYFYPFSLWPMPKFPAREKDEYNENFRYRRDTGDSFLRDRSLVLQIRRNER